MVGYVKHFKYNDKETITIYFNATDKKLSKKYTKMWDKNT